MKKNAQSLVLTFICILLGFMVTLQIRSVVATSDSGSSPDPQRMEELQALYDAEKAKSTDLENKFKQVQTELKNFETQLDAVGGDAVKLLRERLKKAEILAGLKDVEGPGVIVTLDDTGMTPIQDGADPNDFLIHDSDILLVLNELRDAGAEALSINGERILATSEIRCAGNVVSVNNNRISTPFVIKAIGDPDKLAAGLQMRGGIISKISETGIVVKIDKKNHILIGAYEGAFKFTHAQPIEEE